MKKDDLNKKQRYALDTMLSGSNVFLTGDAGTGKTTVIQTFIDEAEKAGKSVLVSATTGIAADNIGYGATTVHRALNISIKFEDYKKKVKSRAELLKEADILIIDEISMCRFDLFNMIAKTIITENEERAVDRLLSGEDKEDVQLIVIGDFYQLPPVITTDDRKILCRMYGSDYGKGGKYEHGYAFMSEYWKEMGFEYIKLDEVCRQNDEGKYSFEDNYMEGGISMVVYRLPQNEKVDDLLSTDVAESEELEVGGRAAVYLEKVSSVAKNLYVIYAEHDYMLEMFAFPDVTKDEMIRIAEGLTVVPTEKTDGDCVMQLCDWNQTEEAEEKGEPVDSDSDREFSFDKTKMERSEERRVGKECRSRWSPYH